MTTRPATRAAYDALNLAEREAYDRLVALTRPQRPLTPQESAELRQLAAAFDVNLVWSGPYHIQDHNSHESQ